MKEKLFVIVVTLFLSISLKAELKVSVEVQTPGSLSQLIASSKKNEITHLTVKGKVNGSDIGFIRSMAGKGQLYWESAKGSLEFLDMAEAQIVSGGDFYAYEHYFSRSVGWNYTNKKFYTKDNIVSNYMFDDCYKLRTLILPKTVTQIEYSAFFTSTLKSLTLPDNLEVFNAKIPSEYLEEIIISENNEHFKIVNGVLYNKEMTVLIKCPVNYNSSVFDIPEGVQIVKEQAFYYCKEIKKFTFPSSLSSFENEAIGGLSLDEFKYMPNVKYGVIGYWTSIKKLSIEKGIDQFNAYCFGQNGFDDGVNISEVYIYSENPPKVEGGFNANTLDGALYVPKGTYDKYFIAFGWGDFKHIYEMKGDETEPQKCKIPTISYYNGKIVFTSDTEGATFYSTITDSDITSYSGNEIYLGVTYNISVYATATGYENSDVATASLCWIDVEPKTEGIENGINQVRANAVLIQSNNGILNISGADDGTCIEIYTTSGVIVGSAKASSSSTAINTSLKNGDIAIVRIGNKSVKIVMR